MRPHRATAVEAARAWSRAAGGRHVGGRRGRDRGRQRSRNLFLPLMVFERLAGQDFAYLTTTGRRTGRTHTIEIWFAVQDGRLYLLSGGGERADWVRNIRRNAEVRVRVGTRTVSARARIVAAGTDEDAEARQLLDAKYMGWREGRRLSSWARRALPVAIDLSSVAPR